MVWVYNSVLLIVFAMAGGIYTTGVYSDTLTRINEVRKLCLVESSGNRYAFKARTKAVGLFQIRYTAKHDYNIDTESSLTLMDMYSPHKAAKHGNTQRPSGA
jgi:hypothetical protein